MIVPNFRTGELFRQLYPNWTELLKQFSSTQRTVKSYPIEYIKELKCYIIEVRATPGLLYIKSTLRTSSAVY